MVGLISEGAYKWQFTVFIVIEKLPNVFEIYGVIVEKLLGEKIFGNAL